MALKAPIHNPTLIPANTPKNRFPVAFSTNSVNKGETTKIAETEISKLPEIIRNSLNTKVESTDLSSFVDFIDSNTFDFDQWKLSDNVLKKFFKNGNLHDCKILEEDMLDFSQKNQSVID